MVEDTLKMVIGIMIQISYITLSYEEGTFTPRILNGFVKTADGSNSSNCNW